MDTQTRSRPDLATLHVWPPGPVSVPFGQPSAWGPVPGRTNCPRGRATGGHSGDKDNDEEGSASEDAWGPQEGPSWDGRCRTYSFLPAGPSSESQVLRRPFWGRAARAEGGREIVKRRLLERAEVSESAEGSVRGMGTQWGRRLICGRAISEGAPWEDKAQYEWRRGKLKDLFFFFAKVGGSVVQPGPFSTHCHPSPSLLSLLPAPPFPFPFSLGPQASAWAVLMVGEKCELAERMETLHRGQGQCVCEGESGKKSEIPTSPEFSLIPQNQRAQGLPLHTPRRRCLLVQLELLPLVEDWLKDGKQEPSLWIAGTRERKLMLGMDKR